MHKHKHKHKHKHTVSFKNNLYQRKHFPYKIKIRNKMSNGNKAANAAALTQAASVHSL
jgi:hypothetical protein